MGSMRLFTSLVAGIALGVILSTTAFVARALELGKEQPVHAPFCTTKEDAIKIARADSVEGIEVARKIFMESPECGWGETMAKPRRVVFSAKTSRGSTVRVIETEVIFADGSKMTFYMIVDVDIPNLQETRT